MTEEEIIEQLQAKLKIACDALEQECCCAEYDGGTAICDACQALARIRG